MTRGHRPNAQTDRTIVVSSEHFPYVVKRRLVGRGLLVSVAFASATGCFSPTIDIPDCAISCISECPGGFECRNGFCARTASDNMCAAGGSSGAAGAGGSASADSGGVGGTSGAGNAPMVGGAGGAAPAPLEVTLGTVPDLCPGQSYQVAIEVSGGKAPYVWTLSDTGNAKLDQTNGSRVELSGNADKSQPEVAITVEDNEHVQQTVNVELNVLVAGPGLCPVVKRTVDLPAPCLNNPYSIDRDVIIALGGTPPFTWTALSIPPGLEFDISTQTVSGTALPNPSNTPLTVRVKDGAGRESELTSTLEYRDKCWLAFTQRADGDTRMGFYDPELQAHAASIEASSNNTGVVDFKFSSDGKLVAYRRATSDRNQELVLVNMPTWQEQVLPIPGSVLSYSWAPGASLLAVAYLDRSGSTKLGGVDATDSDSSFASQTSVPLLNPIEVMDATHRRLDSDLLWLENNHLVAFHGDSQFSEAVYEEEPYLVGFDGSGFTAVTSVEDPYLPPVDLEPAKNGFFVIAGTPSQVFLNFWNYTTDETDVFLRGPVNTAVPDPEGLYVAFPEKHQLDLYFTAESGGTSDPPLSWDLSRGGTVDVGCDSILAYAPKSEQIVCDVQLGSAPVATSEVRIFSQLDASAKAALKVPVSGISSYYQGDAASRRRSFSPNGDLFAFTTRDTVFVANDVSAQVVLQGSRSPLVPADQPGEIAFAPDQSILIWQSGAALGVFALAKNGRQNWYEAENLLPPQPCNEEFVSDPKAWCGRSTAATSLAWSADSRFAAVATAAHGVRVYGLGDFASSLTIAPSEACSTDCNSDFVFQP